MHSYCTYVTQRSLNDGVYKCDLGGLLILKENFSIIYNKGIRGIQCGTENRTVILAYLASTPSPHSHTHGEEAYMVVTIIIIVGPRGWKIQVNSCCNSYPHMGC